MDSSERDLWRRRDEEALLARFGYLVAVSISRLGLSDDPQVEDLEQAGRIGLLKAIRRFDPERGHDFSSLAIPRIRGEVQEFKRAKDTWAKRSGQTKRKRVDAALADLGPDPEPEALAEHLGVSLERLPAYLDGAELPTLISLSGGTRDEDGENPLERLPAVSDDLAEVVAARDAQTILRRALRRLTALQRAAFQAVEVDGWPLSRAARHLGMSLRDAARTHDDAQSLLRSFLKREAERLTQKSAEKNKAIKSPKRRGRPAGRRATEKILCHADPPTKAIAVRLSTELGCSESEVMRRALAAFYREQEAAGGCCGRD